MARILIIYGTTEGHTARIAQALAEACTGAGARVEVAVGQRTALAPVGYDGVIVAASVHAGAYQEGVIDWLRLHREALQTIPAAFVSVCLGVLQKDPEVDHDLDAIRERFFIASGWHPEVTKVVAGALRYTHYGWLTRMLMRRIVAKAGGDTDTSRDYDYTDWTDLAQFGRTFAEGVMRRAATTAAHREVA